MLNKKKTEEKSYKIKQMCAEYMWKWPAKDLIIKKKKKRENWRDSFVNSSKVNGVLILAYYPKHSSKQNPPGFVDPATGSLRSTGSSQRTPRLLLYKKQNSKLCIILLKYTIIAN